jgi:hypothetical protein
VAGIRAGLREWSEEEAAAERKLRLFRDRLIGLAVGSWPSTSRARRSVAGPVPAGGDCACATHPARRQFTRIVKFLGAFASCEKSASNMVRQ